MVEMIDAAECDVGIADTTSGKAKSRKTQEMAIISEFSDYVVSNRIVSERVHL